MSKIRLKEVAKVADKRITPSKQFRHPEMEIRSNNVKFRVLSSPGKWRSNMGMRIGGASPTTETSQSTSVANWQQRQQSFQDMMSALQSGDLSAAQQSFKNLGGNSNVQGNSPLAQLGQALKNGDLAGAHEAAQTLQSNRAVATPSEPSSSTSGSGSVINVTG